MYSVTISDYDGTKIMTKKFESPDAKSNFVRSEYAYTLPQLKNLWAAFDKDARESAKHELYIARMNHMKQYDHVEVEKELA